MAIKTRLAVFLLAIGALVLVPYFAFGAPAHAGDSDSKVKTNTFLFDAGPALRFSPFIDVKHTKAELKRKGNKISVKINTNRLPPGAYTNWWIIFNNPDLCVDGCDGSDFAAADAAVIFATGGIVGADGKAKFKATLEEGDPGLDLDTQVRRLSSTGEGLMEGKATGEFPAEIHYVIRYHGPTEDQGRLDMISEEALTNTFGGGCSNTPAETGDAGDFACWDPQAAVFPMPNTPQANRFAKLQFV